MKSEEDSYKEAVAKLHQGICKQTSLPPNFTFNVRAPSPAEQPAAAAAAAAAAVAAAAVETSRTTMTGKRLRRVETVDCY